MALKKIKIKRKTPLGVKKVYDISVPDEHHYILDNGVVSHNSGFIFASSMVIAIKKLKLKEDEDGNKVTNVTGIRAACKVVKTRYNKPFESVQIKIPYNSGMDPYSGLIDFFESQGVLQKTGNRLLYIDNEGTEHKHFRKNFPDDLLDTIMMEYVSNKEKEEMSLASDGSN